MERPFVRENAAERARLRGIVSSITDRQLELPLPNGWPVYVALAHLAFWDQRSIVLFRQWSRDGITPSSIDEHVVNEALLPFLAAIPPRVAADLAVTSAEVIDRHLEESPDELIAGILALGDKHRLYRSEHRRRHLDGIEKLLPVLGEYRNPERLS